MLYNNTTHGMPAAVYPSLELFLTAAVMSPNQSAAACLKTSGDASSCIPQPRAIPASCSHEPEPVSSGMPQDLRERQQLYTTASSYSRRMVN